MVAGVRKEQMPAPPRYGAGWVWGVGVGLQGVLGVSRRTAEGEKDLITEDSQFEVRNIGARG